MKRRTKIVIVVIVVLIIAAAVFAWSRSGPPAPETTQVERHTLVQEIDFTGRVQAKQIAKLGFETTGVARTIDVKIGDLVSEGQRLAVLDTSLSQLEVAQARANRLSTVDAARVALQAAESAQVATTAQTARTIESARQTVRNSKRDVDQAKVVWEQAVRESGSENSLTQAKYSSVVAAEGAYRTAQAALQQSERAATASNDAASSAVASARTTFLNAQQTSATVAGLSTTAAAEAIAGVQLAKHTLNAPFSGVVTDKTIAAGEVAVGGQAVITVQTVDETEITAQVTETDITKLTIGMPATVTLEAYEDTDTWHTEITAIDPAAVMVEGVPTYKVTLRFLTSDARLRPGLTAAIQVESAKKDNVLAIPRRAVKTADGRTYVQLLGADGITSERDVKTGITGSDGYVEIIDGLREQDIVIVRQPAS